MRIRRRPRLSWPRQVLLPAIALLTARTAGAETYAELNASVTGGATDNALSAATGTPQAADGDDLFLSLRLGGRVFRVARSTQNDLAYAFTATRYRDHDKANGQSHGVTWTTTIALSRPTELTLALTGTYSHLNSSNPLGLNVAAPGGVVGGAPTVSIAGGPVSFIGGSFNETVTHRPRASRLLVQSLGVSTFVPLADRQVSSIIAQHLVRGEALRGRDAALGEFIMGLTWTPGLTDSLGQEISRTSRFLFGQVLAGVRRELSSAWSLSAEGGGLAAFQVERGPIVVGPAWRGAIRYHREFGQAGLELLRSPQPNVFAGEALVVDRVSLSAGLPLDRQQRFFLLGLGSYQRGRQVNSPSITGPFGDGLNVWSASGALAYHPVDVPMGVSLDYSYFNQEGRVATAGGGRALPAVQRQVLMLMVTGTLRDSRPRLAPVAD